MLAPMSRDVGVRGRHALRARQREQFRFGEYHRRTEIAQCRARRLIVSRMRAGLVETSLDLDHRQLRRQHFVTAAVECPQQLQMRQQALIDDEVRVLRAQTARVRLREPALTIEDDGLAPARAICPKAQPDDPAQAGEPRAMIISRQSRPVVFRRAAAQPSMPERSRRNRYQPIAAIVAFFQIARELGCPRIEQPRFARLRCLRGFSMTKTGGFVAAEAVA